MNWDALSIVLIGALVIERLLEAVGDPIVALIPGGVNPNVKRLVYLVVGSVLGGLTGLNILPIFALAPIAGQIVTALAFGAGSQVIHAIIDAVSKKENQIPPPTVTSFGSGDISVTSAPTTKLTQ